MLRAYEGLQNQENASPGEDQNAIWAPLAPLIDHMFRRFTSRSLPHPLINPDLQMPILDIDPVLDTLIRLCTVKKDIDHLTIGRRYELTEMLCTLLSYILSLEGSQIADWSHARCWYDALNTAVHKICIFIHRLAECWTRVNSQRNNLVHSPMAWSKRSRA